MGNIRQYFKAKTLKIQARLPASVSMMSIRVADKQLKTQNIKAMNNSPKHKLRVYVGYEVRYRSFLTSHLKSLDLMLLYMFHMNLASSFPELAGSFSELASSIPELAGSFPELASSFPQLASFFEHTIK